MHHPTDKIAHTVAFLVPYVEQEIALWIHHEGATPNSSFEMENQTLANIGTCIDDLYDSKLKQTVNPNILLNKQTGNW